MKLATKIKIGNCLLLFQGVMLLLCCLSCSKDDFDGQRPDERIGGVLSDYEKQLTEAPYGWKGHLFPGDGSGHSFLFEFNNENRVKMLADIDDETSTVLKESSYRLKATLLPSLYFDTYSYIHRLADPDYSVNGGTSGWGLFSDFEYSVLSANADTILLKGNLNNSRLQLIRATAEEAEAYKAGRLKTLRNQVKQIVSEKPFSYIEDAEGNVFGLSIDTAGKTVSFISEQGADMKIDKFGFALSGLNEMVFSDTLQKERLKLDRFRIKEANKKLDIVGAFADKEYTVWTSNRPLFPFVKLWGPVYQGFRIQMQVPEEGYGTEFENRRVEFLANMGNVASGLRFPQMQVTLDVTEHLLYINLILEVNDRYYSAPFAFSYKLEGENLTLSYEGAVNADAKFLEQYFAPILQGFVSGPLRLTYDLDRKPMGIIGESTGLPGFKFTASIL